MFPSALKGSGNLLSLKKKKLIRKIVFEIISTPPPHTHTLFLSTAYNVRTWWLLVDGYGKTNPIHVPQCLQLPSWPHLCLSLEHPLAFFTRGKMHCFCSSCCQANSLNSVKFRAVALLLPTPCLTSLSRELRSQSGGLCLTMSDAILGFSFKKTKVNNGQFHLNPDYSNHQEPFIFHGAGQG